MSTASRPFIDKTQPAVFKALSTAAMASRHAADEAGLDRLLVELVNVRCSQVNGCVRCLSVHVPAARKAGATPAQLDLLPAWREASCFDARHKAALGLAEAMTRLDCDLPAAQQAALEHFTPVQLGALEWVCTVINAMNRVSIASNHPPAAY